MKITAAIPAMTPTMMPAMRAPCPLLDDVGVPEADGEGEPEAPNPTTELVTVARPEDPARDAPAAVAWLAAYVREQSLHEPHNHSA